MGGSQRLYGRMFRNAASALWPPNPLAQDGSGEGSFQAGLHTSLTPASLRLILGPQLGQNGGGGGGSPPAPSQVHSDLGASRQLC